jgi:hypothetical protein
MDVPITVDTTRANAQVGAFATTLRVKLEAATKALGDIRLSADSTDVERKIAVVRAQLETLKNQRIGVDIDAGAALAKIAALSAELTALGARSPNIQVKVDVDTARAALGSLSLSLTELIAKFQNADLGSTKIAGIGGAVIPAIQSIGQLSGALGLLPAVAAGVATALGAVVIGSQGLSEAFKAQAAAEEAAAAAAKTDAPARQAVTAANQAATAAGQQNVAALQQQVTAGAAHVAQLQAQQKAGQNVGAELKAAQTAQAGLTAELKTAQAATSGNTAALGTYKTAQQQAKTAVAESEAAHKKAKEAADAYAATLQHLAPSAREFVSAVVQLKPAFEQLRLDVQQQLFKGIGDSLLQVGNTALPVLRKGLSDMASSINSVVQQILQFVQQQSSIQAWQSIFSNLSTAAGNLAAAVKPILQIITDVTQVGSEFLPGMATSFAEAAQKAADFVSKAKETGQLKDWIQTGIDAVRVLWGIFSDLVQIIAKVTAAPGPGLLQVIKAILDVVLQLITVFPPLIPMVEAFFAAWLFAKVTQGLIGMVTTIKSVATALGLLKAAEAGTALTEVGTAAAGAAGGLGVFAGALKTIGVLAGAYLVGQGLLAVGNENTGTSFTNMAQDAADTAGKLLTLDFAGIAEKIGRDLKRIPEDAQAMKARWGPVWQGLKDDVTGNSTGISNAINQVKTDIMNAVSPLPEIVGGALGGLSPIITNGVLNIATEVGKLPPLVQASLVQLAPAMRAPTEAALGGLLPIVTSGMQNTTNQVNGLTPQVQAALAPLSPAMQQSANAALGGMLTVVNTGVANITTAVNGISTAVTNVPTTHGTVFTGDGANLLAAAAGGQAAVQGVVPDWLTKFAGDTTNLLAATGASTGAISGVQGDHNTLLNGDASGVTTATGNANAAINSVQDKNVNINARDNASSVISYVAGLLNTIHDVTSTITTIYRTITGGAEGYVLSPMAAGAVLAMAPGGGLSRMSGSSAQIVPPNTWRVIGDRMSGDEAFIPITNSVRSEAILGETANRMGFALTPMVNGGVIDEGDTNTWVDPSQRGVFIPKGWVRENPYGGAFHPPSSSGGHRSRRNEQTWERLRDWLERGRGGHGGGASAAQSMIGTAEWAQLTKSMAFGGGTASYTQYARTPTIPQYGQTAVPATPTALGAGYGGQQQVAIHLSAGSSALDQVLMRILRNAIRVQGGNVQVVLGA